jgi:hypothetical protein
VFWPVTNHKLGRNIVFWPVANHKLGRSIQRWYDQVYDLLLVRMLYVTTKFVICYWSKHCMLRPSLWFVTGQNAVCYDQVYDLRLVRTLCYDQVYDLLLVRTLYVTTKFMICYWSEHYLVFWPVTNHKLGRNIQRSDQNQIINLVKPHSVLTSNKS